MKETYISTNNLQTEFVSSRLIQMFNGFVPFSGTNSAKRTRTHQSNLYFNPETEKYSKTDVGKKLLEFLSGQDWSCSGNKTGFNTIQILNKYGLIKRFYSKDKTKKHIDTSEIIKTEEDIFKFLDIPYVPPNKRNIV